MLSGPLLTGIAEYILNREMGDSLEKVSKPVKVEFYTKDKKKLGGLRLRSSRE